MGKLRCRSGPRHAGQFVTRERGRAERSSSSATPLAMDDEPWLARPRSRADAVATQPADHRRRRSAASTPRKAASSEIELPVAGRHEAQRAEPRHRQRRIELPPHHAAEGVHDWRQRHQQVPAVSVVTHARRRQNGGAGRSRSTRQRRQERRCLAYRTILRQRVSPCKARGPNQRLPVEPKPPSPRPEAPNSSTRRKAACTTGTMTRLRHAHVGCRAVPCRCGPRSPRVTPQVTADQAHQAAHNDAVLVAQPERGQDHRRRPGVLANRSRPVGISCAWRSAPAPATRLDADANRTGKNLRGVAQATEFTAMRGSSTRSFQRNVDSSCREPRDRQDSVSRRPWRARIERLVSTAAARGGRQHRPGVSALSSWPKVARAEVAHDQRHRSARRLLARRALADRGSAAKPDAVQSCRQLARARMWGSGQLEARRELCRPS